jgi:uncharacterized protein (TIGR02646 family)
MKYVRKGPAPEEFERWKQQANADWSPTYADLRQPQKRIVHDALLAEQWGVCCYCGRRITCEDSHIEHFRPQHTYPELQLEYDNLMASCNAENEPRLPLSCGHAKKNGFDEGLHISPTDPLCEQRFCYTVDGAIKPHRSDDAAAIYMIGLLDLDIKFLRHRREQAIAGVFDDEFLLNATDEELDVLRQQFLLPSDGNQLVSFGHVVVRFAEQLLERSAN